MALKVINAAFTGKGWAAEASSSIHGGSVVALEAAAAGTPELALANRDGTHAIGDVAGLAYEDAATTGNTKILVDPVTLAYSAVYARRIGDYQDETISNQQNFTDTGSMKRGVTVLSVGGEFASDQYSSTIIVSGATSDTTGTPVTTVGAVYTYGAGTTNNGLLIGDDAATGGTADAADIEVARVTSGVSGSLLFFRWVGV